MIHEESSAPAHPSTEECFVCYDGLVFIGCLVEDLESAEEAEVIEAVPCRRCASSSGTRPPRS